MTVDGAGMISSLQAQAPSSSNGDPGDVPLEKALQAVSQLFQSQGSTGQQEPPRGKLPAFCSRRAATRRAAGFCLSCALWAESILFLDAGCE